MLAVPGLGVRDKDRSCFSWWCHYPPGWHGRPQYLQSRGAKASDKHLLIPLCCFCDLEEIDACGQTHSQLDPVTNLLHGPLPVQLEQGESRGHLSHLPVRTAQDLRPHRVHHIQIWDLRIEDAQIGTVLRQQPMSAAKTCLPPSN